MFQLVNLILSSGEFHMMLTSVTNSALSYKWFSLLLYITVLYNINDVGVF